MVARGHVENGVVVLDDGCSFREGQTVTVIADAANRSLADVAPVDFVFERAEALRSLIGIWKSAAPPSDEDVDRLLEQAIMEKHG